VAKINVSSGESAKNFSDFCFIELKMISRTNGTETSRLMGA
jgi:hypothetical protein